MKEGGFRDELTENRHRIRERLYLFFSSPIAAAGRLDTNSQAFLKTLNLWNVDSKLETVRS